MANTAFDKILAAAKKAKAGSSGGAKSEDKEFYYPERDKAGNGLAIIRFLPGKTPDSSPFVQTYSHGFQNKETGKWFIDDCPTTIGQDCPVCASNNQFWVPGATDAMKAIGRERKRRMQYIANVLIVSDTKNPDNEGKVMMFKFGAKIFDKILDAMEPQIIEGDDPRDPVNVFDLKEGANFKLRIRKVEGQTNYDTSEFMKVSSIDNGNELLEQAEDLGQFVDPSKFKSYEELEKRLNFVLGNGSTARQASKDDDSDAAFAKKAAEKARAAKESKASTSDDQDGDEDSSDDLAFFRSLAEE